MRLLALDQASRTSGFAIFIDGELRDCGTFTFTNYDIGERLFKIREKVAELIADYDIDYVAFEDIQLQKDKINNVKTFKVLAEVFGVIYELVTELEIDHEAVFSNTWKSTCKIKGRTREEQKKNAQQFVIDTYGFKASQDASDAICIGTHILKNGKKSGYDWSE